jgi:hypothetical protein
VTIRTSSLALLLTTALTGLAPLSAQASCYGSGYSRFCDGIGGLGATYTKPSANGLTDYYDRNGLNRTVIRSSPTSLSGSLGSDLQIIETLRYR